jgi:tetratricopeptide (TPR) repeat protein
MNAPAGIDAVSTERDRLMQEARAHRAAGRVPAALAVLARVQAEHPRFSRLHQERGHCQVLLGNAPAAVEALHEAVRLNPSLPASWDMLEQLYRMGGDGDRAGLAAQRLATLRSLPPEVVMADSLFADGDLAPAEAVIRDFLQRHEDNTGALRLLARIRMAAGALDEAETLLEGVLDRSPDYHAARRDYGMVLVAAAEARRKRGSRPSGCCEPMRRQPRLSQALRRGLCRPRRPRAGDRPLCERLLDGLTPTATGSRRPAPVARQRPEDHRPDRRRRSPTIKASLAARPDNGVAWFSLANLKTYRFNDDEVARMKRRWRQGTTCRTWTASISASRWARRWRTAANTRPPGAAYEPWKRGAASGPWSLHSPEVAEAYAALAEVQVFTAEASSPNAPVGARTIRPRSSSWACRVRARP